MSSNNIAVRIGQDDDGTFWFGHTIRLLVEDGSLVDTGHWQAMKDVPMTKTVELLNVMFVYDIPTTPLAAAWNLKPNLPWADKHFEERVSGVPLNPPPSHVEWPYAQKSNKAHTDEEAKFSHTYPERLWPKWAGSKWETLTDQSGFHESLPQHEGIRYPYGDLQDVVNLLVKEPYTRQAYAPLWFPEDTGSVDGQRVPCTLGYHFMLRKGKLHVYYPIRSCDVIRHMGDDLYMAARLGQWMVEQCKVVSLGNFEEGAQIQPSAPVWDAAEPGQLTMHAVSLHCFEGERESLRARYCQ